MSSGDEPRFLGEYSPRLDEKGRLILPVKYREKLAGGLILTKGQERCLYVYPTAQFDHVVQQIRAAPVTDKKVRDFARVLLGGASDEIPDKQGRITIPAHLRQYAGLERDVTVAGVGARLEIWEATAWSNFIANADQHYAEQAEEVIPGVL